MAAVALGLGVYLCVRTGPWNGESIWSPMGLSFGFTHIVVSLVIAGFGVPLLFRGAPPDFRMSDEALRALLSEARPMTLCLDCRTEIVLPPCPHCQQSSTAFEVRRPADAENARVLLGLEEAPKLDLP